MADRRYAHLKVERVRAIYLPQWPLQTLASFSSPIGFSKKFLRCVSDFEPDLVHLHGHHYPTTWLGAALAHSRKVPTLLTLHGLYALNPYRPHGRSFVEEAFNRTIFRLTLQMCDGIIGLGSPLLDHARDFALSKRPFHVISNGADIKRHSDSLHRRSEFRHQYGFSDRNIVILFTGRFTHGKGVLELAECARRFHDENADLLFVFAGTGPLKDKLQETSRRLRNLVVLDWIPQDQIAGLYAASDIFVLPSKWEAQPLSVIEAMASHLRIVAPLVGDLPNLLKSYPRKDFIRDFEITELAQAIRQAVTHCDGIRPDPHIADYVQRFDWDEIVSQTEKVYREVGGRDTRGV